MILINPYVFATPGPSAYTGLVVAAAPTVWWKLDETSGTTAADSGSSGTTGGIAGGATFATAGVAAASGYAGVGRGVDLAVANALDVRSASALTGAALTAMGGGTSSSSWTMVLVVTGGAGSSYLLSRAGNSAAIIHNYVSGKVEFFATNYTGTDPRTGSQIDLSAVDTTIPHQIAYRYDNGNWSGILDGVEVFNVSRTFALAVGTTLYMGSPGSSSNTAERKFYDFQAYDRAVSTADLAAMWAQRNA